MKLLDFKMPGYSSTVWVNKESKEIYEKKIDKSFLLYRELEVMSVAEGLRRCALVRLHPDELEKQGENLARLGLFFVPIHRVQYVKGFTQSSAEQKPNQPWRFRGVITKDPKDAYEFIHAYKIGDSPTMGRLLGYPTCCNEFFSAQEELGYFDPIWQIAENTPKELIEFKFKHEEANTVAIRDTMYHIISPMLRYLGVRMIPHIPCSFNCKASLVMANQWLDLAIKNGIPGIKETLEMLSMPVEWNASKGIAYVSSPVFKLSTSTVTCTVPHIVQARGVHWPEDVKVPHGLKFPWVKPARLLKLEAKQSCGDNCGCKEHKEEKSSCGCEV